jgi:hypothetical protein
MADYVVAGERLANFADVAVVATDVVVRLEQHRCCFGRNAFLRFTDVRNGEAVSSTTLGVGFRSQRKCRFGRYTLYVAVRGVEALLKSLTVDAVIREGFDGYRHRASLLFVRQDVHGVIYH